MPRRLSTQLAVAFGGLTLLLVLVLLAVLPELIRTAPPGQAVGRLTQALLLAGVVGVALVLLVAVLVARTLASGLEALRQRMLTVADNPAADRAVVLPDDSPGEIGRLALALDRLLVRLRHQLHLREAERDRLDAVLSNLADGVVIVDGARVARLNTAAERLLGVRQAFAAGRTVAEVLRDHELVALVEQARDGGKDPPPPAFVEWRAPRRFLRAAVTRLAAAETGQTLLVLQDLTELRRLETVRRDFVANVSHDLRTPIAAVRAMVETLQDGAIADPAAAKDFLARIDQEVQGLHRLVEQVLELSRLEAGHVELVLAPTEPHALVQSVVHRLAPLAARAEVALRAETPATLPAVLADAERLSQVLIGVVHNAIKFTPPGGEITIGAAGDGESVRLRVSDTGVGLAPEQLERIFERFFKADQARAGGGTGLGLAIAKHVVQLHGGRIWAESAGPDRGTTIHIALPRTPQS